MARKFRLTEQQLQQAAEHGLTRANVRARVVICRWDVNLACSTPLKSVGRPPKVSDAILYQELSQGLTPSEFAEKHNITLDGVDYRVSRLLDSREYVLRRARR